MFLINIPLICSIVLIIGLVALFIISFVFNKKTPLPKGCEDLHITEEGCMACHNTECDIKKKIDLKKIQEELEEEEK